MTYDHFYCERCKKRHVPPEICPGEELSIEAQLTAAQDRVKELEEEKDSAYSERNELVAFLSRLYPSHLCRHSDSDETWEDDWRWIVCIHGPSGQMTWHIHDSEFPKFSHLEERPGHWDGHTTPEKYERLRRAADVLEVR